MNVIRHLPGLRTVFRLAAWLWEPMVFTDPFAGRARPGLLVRTAAPSKLPHRPTPVPRPAARKPSPYHALALID